MSTSDKPLFTLHEHALENAKAPCPLCEGALVIKHSKSGPFLGCEHYPKCNYTKAIVEHERVEDKILSGSHCPECDHELAVKQGRYGMFIGCTNFPQCQHIEETHQHDDAGVACPSCQTGELFEKTNRYGKTFYSCDQYPKCKYVLNYPPVAEPCPQCQWPVMVKRKMASGEVLYCPQKKCGCKVKLGS